MSSANLGWLFYKDYYSAIQDWNDIKKSEKDLAKKVDNLIEVTLKPSQQYPLGNTHFQATTTYPGLILGSGNAHELPKMDGQAILGFDFDYTTGLPIIRGSSIKGVLRSAFKHWEYIAEISSLKTKDEVEKVENEIFVNNDIFFDAVIVSDGKILGDDYITPHGENLLKNPTPLRFIKVLPDVTFRFDFSLHDCNITEDEIFSKEAKSKLFQIILKDLGLGAKTNVGYGKFENFSPFKTQEEKERELQELEEKREKEKQQREEEEKRIKEQKAQKAKEGINTLLECKTLPEAFKLLKDSFGAKPKPTPEQKKVIQEFYNKQKNLSKKDIKTFKKYGVE